MGLDDSPSGVKRFLDGRDLLTVAFERGLGTRHDVLAIGRVLPLEGGRRPKADTSLGTPAV